MLPQNYAGINTEVLPLQTLSEKERRELADLRQFRRDVENVLTKRWKPNAKVAAIAYRIEATKARERDGDRFIIKRRQEDIARQYGMTRPTLSNATKQLEAAGLVEVIETDPELRVDTQGERVWRNTVNPVVINPYPARLPAELPATKYDAEAKDRAKKQRTLAALGREAEKHECPNCHKTGALHLVCECGFDATTGVQPAPPSALTGGTDDDEDRPQKLLASEEGRTLSAGAASLPQAPLSVSEPVSADDGERVSKNLPYRTAVPKVLTPVEDTEAVEALAEYYASSDFKAQPNPAPPLTVAGLAALLHSFIGDDARIIRQVNPKEPPKYLDIGPVSPDIDAYLRGDPRHVYGSRLRRADGTTPALLFDFDDTGHAPALAALRQFRARGWRAVYFARENGGRVWLLFDRPVNAEAARAEAVKVAPALLASRECFPGRGDDHWKDTTKQAVAWSLVRLSEPGKVVSCPMWAYTPEWDWHSAGWLAGDEAQASILEALAHCVNSAALVPVLPQEEEQAPELSKAPAAPRAGVYGEPLVKAALDWWHTQHTEDEIFANYRGPWQRGYFSIRDEKVPSVRRDRDGYHRPTYSDFGDGRRKYDLFDLDCIFRNVDKRAELWRVVDDYLEAHGKPPRYTRPAVAAD